MTTVRELHHVAMIHAQEAALSRARGDLEAARLSSLAGLDLEVQAASLVAREPESEPTRGILYLSAASLAMNASEYDRSERLIAEGLAGSPWNRTRNDLTELRASLQRLSEAPREKEMV